MQLVAIVLSAVLLGAACTEETGQHGQLADAAPSAGSASRATPEGTRSAGARGTATTAAATAAATNTPTPNATPAIPSSSGGVVVRSRSSTNGVTYEVLCTRIEDARPASSVSVRQQSSSENGVALMRVVLTANGTEYAVVVNGVTDAAALAALNASLTNVRCVVTS